MALTQEQQNIKALAQQMGADYKALNLVVGGKAESKYLGAVANQAAMIALVGKRGDWCTRSDDGKTYYITGADGTAAGNWTPLSYPTTDNNSYVADYNTAKS